MANKYKDSMESHPERIKFKCLVNDKYKEIVAYNDIVDYIKQDDGWDGVWKFKQILDHQGPIKTNDDQYRGSCYNILVEWETGKRTWEPLLWADKQGMYNHDPVMIAILPARMDSLILLDGACLASRSSPRSPKSDY